MVWLSPWLVRWHMVTLPLHGVTVGPPAVEVRVTVITAVDVRVPVATLVEVRVVVAGTAVVATEVAVRVVVGGVGQPPPPSGV